MQATKVSENGETIKKMKSQPSLSRSVENAMNELSEIKKFVDVHQINDWLENELNICFTKINEVKERIGTTFTDQLLDRSMKVVFDSEFILPTGMLNLAVANHRFFNIISPICTQFQFLKPQILTDVLNLPVPAETRTIIFHNKFSGPVHSNNLPPLIENLDFSYSFFNSRLDSLPSTITKITLGDFFNLVVTKLPNSLTHLTFGNTFNYPISCLPQSLTHLEFAKSFNSSPEPLPNKLIQLTFGRRFNQPLASLPNSLKILSFQSGSDFNHPLTLPPSLIHLEFNINSKFNQKVEFPQTLSNLIFNMTEYNHSLKLDHCSRLTDLLIGCNTKGPEFHLSLPINTITNLFCSFEDYNPEYLLPSLTSLQMIGGELNILPSLPNLTHLAFDSIALNCSFKNLLPSLTSLTIDCEYDLPINNQLPSSLTQLHISDFNQSVDHLPSHLQKLELYGVFSQPIDNLPTSLTSLTLGTDFNFPVDNLPPFLKKLKIGLSFNNPIDHLPHTLEHLSLGDSFNFPVNNLPSSLQKLHLGNAFNQPLNGLPSSLTTIWLGKAVEQEICHLPNLTSLYCSGKLTFMNPFLPTSLTKLVLSLDNIHDIYLPPKVQLSLIGKDGISLDSNSMKVSPKQPFNKHRKL